mmetsp:Transcript_23907/g.55440  ORF Transcript_23907/g.55440 Transcript_23907/m.55440 type:complete len:194 (+) Transcript_23907:3-584(+)
MIYKIMQMAAASMKLAAEMAAAERAAAMQDVPSTRSWGFLRREEIVPVTPEPGPQEEFHPFGTWVYVTVGSVYFLFFAGVVRMLWESFSQYQKEQYATLDATFEEVFYDKFIHDEGEDLRYRWNVVRPKVLAILQATRFYPLLPSVAHWELQRISDALHTDVWYLRQLARQLRQPPPSPRSTTPTQSQHGPFL